MVSSNDISAKSLFEALQKTGNVTNDFVDVCRVSTEKIRKMMFESEKIMKVIVNTDKFDELSAINIIFLFLLSFTVDSSVCDNTFRMKLLKSSSETDVENAKTNKIFDMIDNVRRMNIVITSLFDQSFVNSNYAKDNYADWMTDMCEIYE